MARTALRSTLDLAIIVTFTVLFSLVWGTWANYPRGFDAYGHVSEMQFILSYFPYIGWNHQWAAGMPLAAFYFTFPFYLLAALAHVGGFSIEYTMQLMAVISFCLLGIAIYGLSYELTKRHDVGLLTALLTLSCTSVWSGVVPTGMYHRVVATPTLPFFLWALARYLHRATKGRYILAVLTLGLAVQSYILIGLITLLALVVILLFSHLPWRKRFYTLLIVGIPGLLLSLHYYLPFAYITAYTGAHTSARFIGGAELRPPPLANFLYPSHESLERTMSLSPLLLPLAASLIILYLRIRGREPVSLGWLRGFGIVSLFLFLYGTAIYFGYPATWYYTNFWPADSLSYLPLFLAPLCGVIIADRLREDVRLARLWPVLFGLLIILIVLSLSLALSPASFHISPNVALSGYDVVVPLLQEAKDSALYRFGTDDAGIAAWFNYKFSNPQTRDYLDQAVLIPDWRYWLQVAVWESKENYNETDYLLDWFSVKWFMVGPPHRNFAKYTALPERYQLISSSADGEMLGFRYRNATPILAATNASVLSMSGGDIAYDNFLRALSHSNFNSQHVITLRGPNYLDDLTLEELSSFDLVILYDYMFHNQERAFQLLADYVRNGGGLIVEANSSPFDDSPSIPEPIPVSHTTATNYGTEWGFTSADHEILEEIDLSVFGPAIYDDGPWGVSSTEETDIRHWAQPILWTNGHPVLVAGQYGEGRVIWTGMNLFYHINAYRNEEESRFLAQMIEWVAGEGGAQPDYEAHFIHPQRRAVKVLSPAKGVLFKESFFPNWHTYVAGRELKIYRAGPDFMYVALPKDTPYPIEVTLEYKKSNLEWISLGISLVTLVGLAAYAIKRCP